MFRKVKNKLFPIKIQHHYQLQNGHAAALILFIVGEGG